MKEVLLALTYLGLSYFILFRYFETSFFISILYSLPNLLLFLPVFLVFYTCLYLNEKYLEKGRFTRFFWISLKLDYVLHTIIDSFARDYNELVFLLTGKENMTIQIQEPGKRREYVPEQERGADKPGTFYMKKLGATKKAKIRDGMVGVDSDGSISKFRQNQVALQMVLNQLDGWENIADNGQEVSFDKSKEKIEYFDMLPDDIQDELIEEFGSVGVQEEEEEEEDVDQLDDTDDSEDLFE